LVAPHDLGADARRPVACEGLVDPRVSARLVVHRVESSCGEEPLHQSAGGVSEGGIETLSLPRAKPVQGNREVVHAHLRHREASPELGHTPGAKADMPRQWHVADYFSRIAECPLWVKRPAVRRGNFNPEIVVIKRGRMILSLS